MKMVILLVHYLHTLDKEAQVQKPLSEMERQDYINQITTLKDTLEQFKVANSSLQKGMESSDEHNKSLRAQVCRLQEIISGLTDEIHSLRDEVSKQIDYNKRHNKMSFGKKCLSSRTKQDDKKSREKAKIKHGDSGTSINTDLEKSEKGESDNLSDDRQDSSLGRTKIR